ncbi:MAG: Pyruvate:ferredoxin oxidoreductase, alpha subunit [Candidatus Fermentimicrarchaeum limneticum]|uniref:Pyruvate:ferredoxin oxidoreductase, alpha subunit n=1 Tax=Fermentimicrarchaeum limneticum TaxID=2795018 RepID=A0A7D5XJD7_FERL1|nr:MAG: Pyruvate:ferredoxin oxidoreductase, alpha subunit [Candidatus Fermentimicrarchaeum limneticum]
MVRKTVESSIAIAEAVKNCEPDVVACYPITPSTHIAETLAKFYADGELKSYITTESEFASISCICGASAAGGRAFSTTSSQGLALMHEVVYAAAGMRLPIAMVVGNRALSAPLNIWCDHQDSVAERDSGWIQLYCESAQEGVDTAIQAFKIAESTMLPAMTCIDGFYLTHTVEPIDVPTMEEVRRFLPKYEAKVKLDPENPLSIGEYALPDTYQSFREDVHKDNLAAKGKIVEVDKEFEQMFGRGHGGLAQGYGHEDADYIFIGMGSVIGNAKEAVDELRARGKKVGVVKIRSFRPFPEEEVRKLLEGKKHVAVFEKSYSLGSFAPVYADVINSLYPLRKRPVVSSFIGGLGGKDVPVKSIHEIFKMIRKREPLKVWF